MTPKVAEAVKEYAAGKVEYRNDKSGNIHAPVGKMSFPEADLLENFNALHRHDREGKALEREGSVHQADHAVRHDDAGVTSTVAPRPSERPGRERSDVKPVKK